MVRARETPTAAKGSRPCPGLGAWFLTAVMRSRTARPPAGGNQHPGGVLVRARETPTAAKGSRPCPGLGAWFLTAVMRSRTARPPAGGNQHPGGVLVRARETPTAAKNGRPCPGSGAWFLTAVMRSRTGRRFVGASIARPCGLPGSLRFRKAVRRGQDPSLQITRRQGIIGKNANFRQVCRGRIYAPRGVCPLYRNIRAVATGGIYAAPTDLPVMFTLP